MKKKPLNPWEKVRKAQCALFIDGYIIAGECTVLATKRVKDSKEATFAITMMKKI